MTFLFFLFDFTFFSSLTLLIYRCFAKAVVLQVAYQINPLSTICLVLPFFHLYVVQHQNYTHTFATLPFCFLDNAIALGPGTTAETNIHTKSGDISNGDTHTPGHFEI